MHHSNCAGTEAAKLAERLEHQHISKPRTKPQGESLRVECEASNDEDGDIKQQQPLHKKATHDCSPKRHGLEHLVEGIEDNRASALKKQETIAEAKMQIAAEHKATIANHKPNLRVRAPGWHYNHLLLPCWYYGRFSWRSFPSLSSLS